MATLKEIRAKLKEQETRATTGNADNNIYPHWNMQEGTEAVLRFLPDGDESNTFFWRERLMIKLPFSGIKGDTESKPVQVQIPCMEMYNQSCPVLNEVRAWFKDPSLETMGKKYWKKKSYLFQGFVVDNPLKDDVTPDNPIRRFLISPQIFQIIKTALLDPEMEDNPTDYVNGIDFRVKKHIKGNYPDYTTSSWSRRTRALSETELAAINEHGLFSLSEFLPKKPTDVEIKVMQEMFEASVDGEAYDGERWSQYFKPLNYTAPAAARIEPTAKVKSSPKETTEEETSNNTDTDSGTNEESSSSPTGSAKDILAMIRARQAQS